jgi:hypothetical protein
VSLLTYHDIDSSAGNAAPLFNDEEAIACGCEVVNKAFKEVLSLMERIVTGHAVREIERCVVGP